MTARRRATFRIFGGIGAAIAFVVAPAIAQNSEAPIDVTAAPPASADTIGPSQLQNFNLQGTVTRPSERTGTTAATPAAVSPEPRRAENPAAARGPDTIGGSTSPTGEPIASRAAAATSRQNSESPASTAISEMPTPSLPLEVSTGPAEKQSSAGSTGASAASLSNSDGFWSWPWLAALIALMGGAAFIAWSRRSKDRRHADPAVHARGARAPGRVARDPIVETHGCALEPVDGRAVQQPAVRLFHETTGVVAGDVEPAPEDRRARHAGR